MPPSQPSRARIAAAWITVILTVVAVWLVVDYRTQPPAVKTVISNQ